MRKSKATPSISGSSLKTMRFEWLKPRTSIAKIGECSHLSRTWDFSGKAPESHDYTATGRETLHGSQQLRLRCVHVLES